MDRDDISRGDRVAVRVEGVVPWRYGYCIDAERSDTAPWRYRVILDGEHEIRGMGLLDIRYEKRVDRLARRAPETSPGSCDRCGFKLGPWKNGMRSCLFCHSLTQEPFDLRRLREAVRTKNWELLNMEGNDFYGEYFISDVHDLASRVGEITGEPTLARECRDLAYEALHGESTNTEDLAANEFVFWDTLRTIAYKLNVTLRRIVAGGEPLA